MSVKKYDPRYLEVWRDAGLKTVSLPLPDEKACVNLRHRLYRMRVEMGREKHDYFPSAERATITIQYILAGGAKHRYTNATTLLKHPASELKGAKWSLEIGPPDDSFDEALSAAGYGVPEAPSLD